MRQLWEKWVPRTEDYWATFSSPFRRLVTDAVDKATPPGGSVMDFGCGAGVQTFLLRQRRPDILIYAIDCNPYARNLTQVLMADDPLLTVDDTPKTAGELQTVDTIVSIFTSTYFHPEQFRRVIDAFREKAPTIIFAEPTSEEDVIEEYAGMPCGGYRFPYGHLFPKYGWTVEMVPILDAGAMNMITVGKRPDAGLAQLA